MSTPPIIMWFRRDLRISDHAALTAACTAGAPVIPVVIRDTSVRDLGAAPKWRWGLGVAHLSETLAGQGSRLILRSGPAKDVLNALVKETGAKSVFWSRLYDPDAVTRDTYIKADLKNQGID
ncbi:MAG: deoxyribodipyrimidine photo-lyase, partial [Pseudomonadota bacterium]